jgi:hypothetical protein
LLVSEDLLLYDLHLALQIAMGWENCHLFEFTFGKYRIGLVDDSFAHLGYGKDELLDAEEISLGKILSKKGDKLNYTYDFGDDWKHTITVEKVIKSDDFLQTPICLGGERNCPPEDCGGVYGFYEMLEILKNKKHPDYKEMIEFLGDFDPDDFDKDEVNSFFENFWLNDEDDELAF